MQLISVEPTYAYSLRSIIVSGVCFVKYMCIFFRVHSAMVVVTLSVECFVNYLSPIDLHHMRI